MSTLAQIVSNEDGAHATIAKPGRLRISAETIENTKGAVRTTIELLGVAAQMTQSVPYLGAVSTALTEFMKIQDEVELCKDKWKEAIIDAGLMNDMIKKFHDRCIATGRSESALNEMLREAFTELEVVILECTTTLQSCKVDSKRKSDRIGLYWKRASLLKSIDGCVTKMGQALQHFDRILHVDMAFLLDDIRVVVGEIREAVRTPSLTQLTPPLEASSWPLRAAPAIFYGRKDEVDHSVNLIVTQRPARVAILGPGGIGKTSIALTVLYHPEVKALYQSKRCFVSCEATSTAEGVVRALMQAFSFTVEGSASPEFAQRRLLSYLDTITGIICLDNLETPWQADTAAVEDLLVEIASLKTVALIITSRVTDTPLIGWSSPALQPIIPYSRDPALQTWDTICSTHGEYAVKLVEAVDCVPLAVTLLARMARTETEENIWRRWQAEHTKLVRSGGKEHRLNSLDVSIEISLQALGRPDAINVLSVLCTLPSGLWDARIPMYAAVFEDNTTLREALTLLKQYSLVYTDKLSKADLKWESVIRVLSPISLHMLEFHPVTDEVFLKLGSVYMLPLENALDHSNLSAYIQQGFTRGQPLSVTKQSFIRGPCPERCLQIVCLHSQTLDSYMLPIAVYVAQLCDSPLQATLLLRLAVDQRQLDRYEAARSSLSTAIELNEQSGNQRALVACWVQWIFTCVDEFWDREYEKPPDERAKEMPASTQEDIKKICDLHNVHHAFHHYNRRMQDRCSNA